MTEHIIGGSPIQHYEQFGAAAASEAEMLALPATMGGTVYRTDLAEADGTPQQWILAGHDPTDLAQWKRILRYVPVRDEIVANLKLAADGRRAYAEGAPERTRQLLLDEAAAFDTAVRIAEGDLRSLAAMLPVRMWTQEMNDDLDGRSTP